MPSSTIHTPDLERRVRTNDPETSWAAAVIGEAAATSVRDAVLAILGAGTPLTDDEIYDAYRAAGGVRSAQRVRTAREEMVHPKLGDPLIQVSEIRGASAAGNPAQKWEIAS